MNPSPLFVIGTCFAFLGGVMRYICYRTLGRHFTFQLSMQQKHTLVKDGPYSVVRHPGYTAFFLNYTGMVIWYLAEVRMAVSFGLEADATAGFLGQTGNGWPLARWYPILCNVCIDCGFRCDWNDHTPRSGGFDVACSLWKGMGRMG